MAKPTLILVSNSGTQFSAIKDSIDSLQLVEKIITAYNAQDALENVPLDTPCIIVTASSIPHVGKSNDPTAGTRMLIAECKNKNPKCWTILYSIEHYDLRPEEFSACIDSIEKGSYNLLREKIQEYCKS